MRRTPNSLSCSVGTTRECRRLESLVAGLAMLRPDASRAIQTMLTVEAERKQMKLNIRRQLSVQMQREVEGKIAAFAQAHEAAHKCAREADEERCVSHSSGAHRHLPPPRRPMLISLRGVSEFCCLMALWASPCFTPWAGCPH